MAEWSRPAFADERPVYTRSPTFTFRLAVARAETEFRAQVGDDVATVVALGLEAYASR